MGDGPVNAPKRKRRSPIVLVQTINGNAAFFADSKSASLARALNSFVLSLPGSARTAAGTGSITG